jgi:site-specific recombinase XerD
MVEALFEKFIREKTYLSNISKRTGKFYLDCQRAYLRTVGNELPTKENLKEFVIKLQQSGIKATTVNVYIRGINSWLSWLLENEHIPEKLRIKQIKEPERTLKVFSDEQIRRLLAYKPKNFFEHRLYAMVCLAIDTGARIDEIITLTRDRVDIANLLVTLRGKGDKERIVPMSIECRRELYNFIRRHDKDYVFPSKGGENSITATRSGTLRRCAGKWGSAGLGVPGTP